ncbi:MAG: hypothetical protein EAZ85_03685 [Bacteroidetes bacterium]|nr:MAG: hypothetical protein EAZ85_03685 [Bacteroidota bacterium]TAG89582.1 MAG: hypothetical protein EAZ20_06150 [Bacteroidota bacterium]
MKCKGINNKKLLQQITKNYFLGKFEDNTALFKIIDKINLQDIAIKKSSKFFALRIFFMD